MKEKFSLWVLALLCSAGYAQEFRPAEGIYIGNERRIPSLSILTPEFTSGTFTLREVDFSKEVKREVDFVAVMEEKRQQQESSYIQLESPVPTLNSFEKQMIEVTNELNVHQRGSNYDIYSGEKKIPAYQEFRADFIPPLSSPYTRRKGAPYFRYSPFLR